MAEKSRLLVSLVLVRYLERWLELELMLEGLERQVCWQLSSILGYFSGMGASVWVWAIRFLHICSKSIIAISSNLKLKS